MTRRHASPAALLLLLLANPAPAAEPMAGVTVTPLASTLVTATGKPITLPAGPARVVASIYLIAPGGRLPLHQHPHARYAYVLEGSLHVSVSDTGQGFDYRAGEFAVEAIGQRHAGENDGTIPARLLVIDQLPADETVNTILHK